MMIEIRCVLCTHLEHPLESDDPDVVNGQPWHDSGQGICRTDRGAWGCPCAGVFTLPMPCPDCEMTFTREDERKEHILEVHDEDQQVKALNGEMLAALRQRVFSRLQNIADPNPAAILACGYCEKPVGGTRDLLEHVKIHRKEIGV